MFPQVQLKGAPGRRFKGLLPLVFVLSLLSAMVEPNVAEPLQAQSRGTALRVVHGRVEDKDGKGIKGAVVYLKDDKASSVKTFIADENGAYRFVQLAMTTDYEIWAQTATGKSATKTISSFDSKADITFTLKIDQ